MNLILKTTTILLLTFFFYSCTSTEEINPEDNDVVTNTNDLSLEAEILLLINNHRTSIGLASLETLEAIKSQTDAHTDYMIAKGAISHDNFSDRVDFLRDQVNAKQAAENVASGYTTAQSVVNGWLNSEGHRKNIEGNFTDFNITAKKSSNNRLYYTNIFIRR